MEIGPAETAHTESGQRQHRLPLLLANRRPPLTASSRFSDDFGGAEPPQASNVPCSRICAHCPVPFSSGETHSESGTSNRSLWNLFDESSESSSDDENTPPAVRGSGKFLRTCGALPSLFSTSVWGKVMTPPVSPPTRSATADQFQSEGLMWQAVRYISTRLSQLTVESDPQQPKRSIRKCVVGKPTTREELQCRPEEIALYHYKTFLRSGTLDFDTASQTSQTAVDQGDVQPLSSLRKAFAERKQDLRLLKEHAILTKRVAKDAFRRW